MSDSCGIGQFLKTAGAALAFLAVTAFVFVLHFCSFSGGEKTYYLYSASSQAEMREELSFGDLFFVRGESAVYRTEGEDAEKFAEELAEKYRAELLFEEKAGGTLSGYYYSPLLKGGTTIGGKFVNLHIAIRADGVAAGTPVIFGGW